MEERLAVADLGVLESHSELLEQFKKNDEVFRNTMEAIFQKYSNLDDPGPDVCFKTMTFRTREGVVPIQSAEAEQEIQHLRNRAEQSIQVLEHSKDEQMDVSQRTENDVDSSLQMENEDVSMWHGTETSQLSVNSASGSRSCLWDLSQPEEEDGDLERTLNSHNKTLLDIYPSMLNHIREVYRRQHVTKAANAVLRRYRRQRWHSSRAQSSNHVLSNSFNHTLNRTMESCVPVQKLPHTDITSYHKDLYSYEEAPVSRSSQKPSPKEMNKNSFLASSRSNQKLSPLMTKRTLSLASIRSSPEISSLKAMRDPSTVSNSKNHELSPLTTKRNVSLAVIRSNQELSASLSASSSSRELSPLKAIQNASLATSSSSRELSSLKAIRKASRAASNSSGELSPLQHRNASFAARSISQELSPLKAIRNVSCATSSSRQELSPLKAIRNSSCATTSSSRQELSPLKAIRNASLAASSISQELSPLKAIRNSSCATSSSRQELSPLKAIRNSSCATSSSRQELSPLKAIRNSSCATSSSRQELSPLKPIRNASLAASSISQELSPLKAIRNSSCATSSSRRELSPLKVVHNSPLASSACFYSPKRVDCENSPVAESRYHWKSPGLHLNSKPQHQPVRVLDLSTPPSSAYDTQLDVMPESDGVLSSAVWSPRRSVCNSPLKGATSVSLISQAGRPVIPSPSHHCPSQLGQQFSGAFEERECFRDPLYSPVQSTRKTLTGNPSLDRSPLKSRVFSLEQEQPTSSMYCPKQTVPMNHTAPIQTFRSPYRSQQEVWSSPYHSPCVFSDHQENLAMPEVLQHHQENLAMPEVLQHHQENLAMPEVLQHHQENLAMPEVLKHSTKLTKRHQPFSDNQSTSSSVSHMSSRQIDAEFMRLYHHFICQGNSPSCPTSSCHLCDRQLQTGDQKPPSILSNMSALALTPVGSQQRKRRREPEVEESLRIKRFRESCSPKQQQFTKCTRAAVANPSEEKCIWNRALLLQCPSPRFLRASGSTRKSSRSQTGLQSQSYSPSWRDTSGSVGAVEATSPVRVCNQSGVSLLPSVSRRRLLYGPLQ